MKKTIQEKLNVVTKYLELLVAAIITVIIALSIINMIVHICQNPMEIQDSERFYNFMNDALSLIVGIEFLKMIIIPTSNNVIETLLFAVSRHIIIDHGLGVMIIGTICIFLLFVIKRYLFSKPQKKEVFSSSTRLSEINTKADTFIPIVEVDEQIGDYVERELNNRGLKTGVGVCIETDQMIIKVESLNETGEIERISFLKKSKK